MRGFTLIELMVALTISTLILLALLSLFVNMSRSSTEFKKSNDLIDNGRFALQALASEIEHAGYWGGYVPGFDNLTWDEAPLDVPTAIPDPCKTYATWTTEDRLNLIGLPVVSFETLPSGAGCVSPLSKKATRVHPLTAVSTALATDAVVIRNLERCLPGIGNCPADVAGAVYMQHSQCAAESINGGQPAGASANSIVFQNTASATDDAYTGVMLRIRFGTGANQVRWISGYVGSTRTATVTPDWATTPDLTSWYTLDYSMSTVSWPLHNRACTATGTPATQAELPVTAGVNTPKRRFRSNIYYIHDYPHPEDTGVGSEHHNEVIPTLVRSSFDFASGANAHQAPVPLVEGIEAMRIELGIDNLSDSGDPVDYTDEVVWADANHYISPTNRGDGSADIYKRCTTAAPCTLDELMNVVSAKIYVLVRARDPDRAETYTDSRTYCLGEFAANGTCPADNTIAAANDHYQRHVFTRSVRIVNVSSRRETPP